MGQQRGVAYGTRGVLVLDRSLNTRVRAEVAEVAARRVHVMLVNEVVQVAHAAVSRRHVMATIMADRRPRFRRITGAIEGDIEVSLHRVGQHLMTGEAGEVLLLHLDVVPVVERHSYYVADRAVTLDERGICLRDRFIGHLMTGQTGILRAGGKLMMPVNHCPMTAAAV